MTRKGLHTLYLEQFFEDFYEFGKARDMFDIVSLVKNGNRIQAMDKFSEHTKTFSKETPKTIVEKTQTKV